MSENHSISKEDVQKVAQLARIHLEEAEAAGLTNDLQHILDYITKLEKLDVTNVNPTSHVLELQNVYREDAVTANLSQEEALSFAVEKKNGFFKVPKVIE